jgi:hypothetical protein
VPKVTKASKSTLEKGATDSVDSFDLPNDVKKSLNAGQSIVSCSFSRTVKLKRFRKQPSLLLLLLSSLPSPPLRRVCPPLSAQSSDCC